MHRLPESWRARRVGRRLLATAFALSTCVAVDAAPQGDRRKQSRLDEALSREGDALVRLADDASRGRSTPADFSIEWGNDFFKAQPGTFVPFTITFDGTSLTLDRALMYVRAERVRRDKSTAAYETIFPLQVDRTSSRTVVRRGFAVPPGKYRVIVAIRESPEDPLARPAPAERRAAVLVRDLDVPDFWTGELTTSTVMVADRLELLEVPVPAGELDENPYVVGSHRIHPSTRRIFTRNSELIVVFLVYNPTVGPDKQFDVQVDYHLYRKDPGGGLPGTSGEPAGRSNERYVTRTNPQRFNPSLMGAAFDPAAGTPVLAGQGILLSAFEPGHYRLGITVTDLLSRKTVLRDVAFTVIGS